MEIVKKDLWKHHFLIFPLGVETIQCLNVFLCVMVRICGNFGLRDSSTVLFWSPRKQTCFIHLGSTKTKFGPFTHVVLNSYNMDAEILKEVVTQYVCFVCSSSNLPYPTGTG